MTRAIFKDSRDVVCHCAAVGAHESLLAQQLAAGAAPGRPGWGRPEVHVCKCVCVLTEK